MVVSRIYSRTFSLTSQLKFPTIKFRHGPNRDQQQAGSASTVTSGQSQQPDSGTAIYDFQLPMKYRRRAIDDDEIAYINRGGPE